MTQIKLTQNETYTFAKQNNVPIILDSSDGAPTTTNFNNNIQVSASNGNGTITTYSTNSSKFNLNYGGAIAVLDLHNLSYSANADCFMQMTTNGCTDNWSMGIDATTGTFKITPATYLSSRGLNLLGSDISDSTAFEMTLGDRHSTSITRPFSLDQADVDAGLYVQGSGDSKIAIISAIMESQGDACFYFGQGTNYGGYIGYRGDSDAGQTAVTEFQAATSDHISIGRNNSNTLTEVIRFGYSSNDVSVVGTLTDGVSDERLKENIITIDNAVDKINLIRGVSFDYNKKAIDVGYISQEDSEKGLGKGHIGVIAQEIEKVLPQVVKPAPCDGDYKTVEYDKIVALLIEGIKEQQETINLLTKRITKLEKNNEN